MAHWEPVLLANVDRPNSEKIDTYLKHGGYKALRKALSMASCSCAVGRSFRTEMPSAIAAHSRA